MSYGKLSHVCCMSTIKIESDCARRCVASRLRPLWVPELLDFYELSPIISYKEMINIKAGIKSWTIVVIVIKSWRCARGPSLELHSLLFQILVPFVHFIGYEGDGAVGCAAALPLAETAN